MRRKSKKNHKKKRNDITNPRIERLGLSKKIQRGIRTYGRKNDIKLSTLKDLADLGTYAVSSLPGIGHRTLNKLETLSRDLGIAWNGSRLENEAWKADVCFFEFLAGADLSDPDNGTESVLFFI